MRDESISVVTMLKREKQGANKSTAPTGLDTEALVYKAAAALFDFISFSIDETDGGLVEEADPDDTLGLIGDFRRYIASTNYPPTFVARRWLAEVPDEKAAAFTSMLHSGRVFHGVSAYIPVLCVDMPIYRVQVDEEGHATDLDPCESLLISARISGWPGRFRPVVALTGPEAIVTVCTPKGLSEALVSVESWFRRMVAVLEINADALAERSLMEAAFLSSVRNFADGYAPRYRSDLDFGFEFPDL